MSVVHWENDPEAIEAQLEWSDRGARKGGIAMCGNKKCRSEWHGKPQAGCPGSHMFPLRID